MQEIQIHEGSWAEYFFALIAHRLFSLLGFICASVIELLMLLMSPLEYMTHFPSVQHMDWQFKIIPFY